MNFLEKDLEEIVWESNNKKLRERGLLIDGIKKRQLRIGNYGISDIVTFERIYEGFGEQYLLINVFELKKEKAGMSAFLQAIRYCKGIETYLNEYKPNIICKFEITLCAKEIDKSSDFIFLTDFIESENYGSLCSLSLYSFKYDIDGIKFKRESGYNLIDKGF